MNGGVHLGSQSQANLELHRAVNFTKRPFYWNAASLQAIAPLEYFEAETCLS
jgi:hypothetical protein